MLFRAGGAILAVGLAILSGCGLDTVGTADIGDDAGDGEATAAGVGGALGTSGHGGQAGHGGGGGAAGHATGGTFAGGSGGQVSFPCGASRGDCDGNPANGCETDTDTSAMDCGACGHACPALAHMTASCSKGICGAACADGFGDCDGKHENGCETSLADDPTSCGSCGKACVAGTHATPTCQGKICGVSCAPGFGDCDQNPADGCEIDLSASVLHCGACANACPAGAHGVSSCAGSQCQIACDGGHGDCDGIVANGCETDTTSSDSHCGSCGNTCAVGAHAGGSCVASACVASCDPGYADCDSDKTNGCESALATSVLTCGSCAHACGTTNAAPSCAASVCVETCDPGFGDCDGKDQNGCETDVSTSATSCGSCGHVCGSTNGVATCAGGTCAIACAPGFEDCDGDTSNGCEAALAMSATSCGACGHVCGAANGTPSCGSGVCSFSCAPGFGHCSGVDGDGCETKTATSVTDCGSCGHVCGATNGTASCAAGACSFQCAQGHAHCSGVDSTGCETLIAGGDASNCGACGHVCGSANAVPSCVASACVFGCAPGFAHCSPSDSTGCESNLTSPLTCGACGHVCGNANGTPSCSAGVCSFACASGYAHCGASDGSGCDTAVATDPKNCGTCGHDCLGATCTAGVCQSITVASGEAFPLDIVLDASGLYWVGWGTLVTDHYVNGTIRSFPTGASTPLTLASGQTWPTHLALDGTSVYWTNRGTPAMSFADGQIAKALKGKTGATVLLAGQNLPYGIAVSATSIFWTSTSASAIGTADLDGMNPKTLITGTAAQPLGLSLRGSSLYWTAGSGFVEMAHTDGSARAQVVGGVPSPEMIVTDAAGIYFVVAGTAPAFVDGVVYRANLDGTGVSALAIGQNRPLGVAVDATYVYWTEQGTGPGYLDGTVRRTLKTGSGAVETLASQVAHPAGIAVDAAFAYYTMPGGGLVMKVAK